MDLQKQIEVPTYENLKHLCDRLKHLYHTRFTVNDRTITLYGSNLEEAKKYCSWFINPDNTECIRMPPALRAISRSVSFVSHIEQRYQVVFIGGDLVELRGSKRKINIAHQELNLLIADCYDYGGVEELPRDVRTKLIDLCQEAVISFNEFSDDTPFEGLFALYKHLQRIKMDKPGVNFGLPLSSERSDDIKIQNVDLPMHDDTGSTLAPMHIPSSRANMTSREEPKKIPKPLLEIRAEASSSGSRASNSDSSDVNYQECLAGVPGLQNLQIPIDVDPNALRHVIIDASNVAYQFSNNQSFEVRGIILALRYFLERGHRAVKAILPRYRQAHDVNTIEILEKAKLIVLTPSRKVDGKRQTSDDDQIILDLAIKTDGVVVSNDQFRNKLVLGEEYQELINTRLISYFFMDNIFVVPNDPNGAYGPSTSQILRKQPIKNISDNEPVKIDTNFPPLPQKNIRSSSVGRTENNFKGRSQSRPRKKNQTNSGTPFIEPLMAASVNDERDPRFHQLIMIFPENEAVIRRVLKSHPSETNLDALAVHIL